MRLSFFSAALLAGKTALVAASPVKPRSSSSPSVTIQNGTVLGVELSGLSQEVFLGIPFAQPPLGDLRFRRPQSINSTFEGGVFEAFQYSPYCPGIASNGPNESEDCLTLNIVRPAGTSEVDRLPVATWIYGGSFQRGGSANPEYNTSYIVQRSVEMGMPIIAVSVNYRTNVLGFFNSKELKEEGSQNAGIYDQRLALHWIQENIGAFGGDASKVTIWGESAGAISVAYHLIAYGLISSPLFSAAILESGNAHTTQFAPLERSQQQFDAVLAGTGCASAVDALGCLRALPFSEINKTSSAFSFFPVVDGELISAYPSTTLDAGSFVQVPVLMGVNTDEGTSFGSDNLTTTADLAASLLSSFPGLSNSSIEKLFELYSDDPSEGCPYNTGDTVLSTGLQDKRSNAIVGDLRFHAGRRELAELMSKSVPVYSYHFDQATQNATVEMGVTHFDEVDYVFGIPEYQGDRPGDRNLSRLMTSQWVSFMHDHTPNNHGIPDVPTWPTYNTSAPTNLYYSRKEVRLEADDWRKEQLAFVTSLNGELWA
ncbi:hypothetical protein JCM8097_008885 [Rhodosporidiobolus ruineniae]